MIILSEIRRAHARCRAVGWATITSTSTDSQRFFAAGRPTNKPEALP
ncbi:MAG: hypothetical protein LC799_34915 [Actinobacteria bacterium]|nr:hypothetical protein [Actinomycetota bacterium]